MTTKAMFIFQKEFGFVSVHKSCLNVFALYSKTSNQVYFKERYFLFILTHIHTEFLENEQHLFDIVSCFDILYFLSITQLYKYFLGHCIRKSHENQYLIITLV